MRRPCFFGFGFKVGMIGFEPTTSCSQSRRATKLRYIPLNLLLVYHKFTRMGLKIAKLITRS